MKDRIYIDTRPGRGTMFSPPKDVEDYSMWLLTRYNKFQRLGGGEETTYFGLSQKVNEIIYAMVHHRRKVVAFGLYAGIFAKAIEAMALPAATAHIEKEKSHYTPEQKQKLADLMVTVDVVSR